MISAVILAGGSGKRMGGNTPKQFLMLAGKPVIWYSLQAFSAGGVDEIILVTREEDMEFCREEIVRKGGFPVARIVAGGSERYLSVENGLRAVSPESDIVIIHDGARPLVTTDIIERVLRDAKAYGAATAAMPVKDTIKIADPDGFGRETPDRNTLYQIQTPQAFRRALLETAFAERRKNDDKQITDDTMLVERYTGTASKMTEGSYRNIKVTTPEDLPVAELFLQQEG